MPSQVTSRRVHKVREEAKPEIELVSTDPAHVLSMPGETRLDWLQMGLTQASQGKMKVDAIGEVLTNPAFGPSDSSSRKALKAMMLANLHLFGSKQKKAIQEAVAAWGSGGKSTERAKNGDQTEKSGSPASGDRGSRDSSSDSKKKKRRRRDSNSADSGDADSREKRKRRDKHRSRSRDKKKSRSREKKKSHRSRSREKKKSRSRSREKKR